MRTIETVSELDAGRLDQLPALLVAARLADGHEPIGEHKFLRLKQRDDLAVAMLAHDRGRLIGYAHTLAYADGEATRVSCEYVVHPDERGRGLEAEFIARAVEHARAQRARRIDVWAYNDSASSQRRVVPFGFVPDRRLLHLHRHVREVPTVVAPRGLTVRRFSAGTDESVVLYLNRRIFAEHPEQGLWTADDLSARMGQPWFNAQDLLLLEVDGVAVGFCWLKVEPRGEEGLVGEIYVIGVAPEARGNGAGRYLLSRALQRLAEHRVQVAAIYVDEANAGAVRLYQSSGFHSHHVDVCYTLDLGDAALQPGEAAA